MTEVIEKTENKKGYKKTKLGWIPDDWDAVKIKNLTCVKSGSTPLRANYNKYFKDGKIKWVKTLDLNNGVLQDTQEKITDIAIRESSCSIFPKNTVLVAMYGGFNQIGRTGLMNFDGCINQALSAILPNDKFDPVYMLNWLNYNVLEWRNYAASSRKDPNITKNDVENFIVILPSKQEQEKIIKILSIWDDGIEILEKFIEQKTIYKKYLMQKLLIGKDRLKNNLIEISEKNTSNQVNNVLSVTNSRGFINQDEQFERNVASKNLNTYKIVRKGEFAYNPSRINVGSIDLLSNFDIGIVSPIYVVFKTNENKLLKEYFKHYFKTQNFFEQMKTYTQGGVRDNLNFKNLQMMRLNIPPLDQQRKISNILNCCDEEIQLLNSKLEKLKEQKKGLMQKLLTGQIRVKI